MASRCVSMCVRGLERSTPSGGVPEWSIGTVLKTVVGESLPWVRIPPPPFARDWTTPATSIRAPCRAVTTPSSRRIVAPLKLEAIDESESRRRGGMADAEDLKSSGGNPVWVQFPPPVLRFGRHGAGDSQRAVVTPSMSHCLALAICPNGVLHTNQPRPRPATPLPFICSKLGHHDNGVTKVFRFR
jgi:hypothetical protein